MWYECEDVIPEFDENGNLPPGVHFCEWEEFKERFCANYKRNRRLEGLELAMAQLKAANCRTMYINGSGSMSVLQISCDAFKLLPLHFGHYGAMALRVEVCLDCTRSPQSAPERCATAWLS